MNSLPTGTVSLLFSDIEGSTVLLSRLGPAYADALDGQRRVLRKAWAEHGGTELGTEGDSFYVVFATAEGAVAAAAQAQRELAAFEWPAGERVRVRIGIHTGAPTPHDGAYVGMDVHRAARIAGAAHGGQVLISSATAELASGSLPERVALRDLGSHQLKDIAHAEHLFQLTVDGLPSEFPPPKTLGAASSLPRPATPLVGRDGELAELSALLGSPEVRLVTLTGPGGSGKTRLAVAVAQGLVERFPDGVFFVPLAAVTTADVMWTSIAEVLDVPPEGRIPPGFFEHVAHRSALFVLDNLEQIHGADTVVAELLDHAPRAVVIATSRRPVNVAGEIQHAVPPLELPENPTLGEVQKAGAVQMFVQHARAVKASFALTTANAADVAALCARLDGLPLAIELAAARTKLLSPAALLTRLDKALDIAAAGSLGPSRQKTLRDTIAWSHDLLTAEQQVFFRHLGVFAGGADLEAINAVTTGVLDEGVDPFDLVAELVDVSLVTIAQDTSGEPRVGLLETIRAYALAQLEAAGEVEGVRQRHAEHFAAIAQDLERSQDQQFIQARARFEGDLDNFREALSWTLETPSRDGGRQAERTKTGLALASAFGFLARYSGYLLEGQSWLQQAVNIGTQAGPFEDTFLCQILLAETLIERGEYERSKELLGSALAAARASGHPNNIMRALGPSGHVAQQLGDHDTARRSWEEKIEIARATGNDRSLSSGLGYLFALEAAENNFERAAHLLVETREVDEKLGDEWSLAWDSAAYIELLREQGEHEAAQAQLPLAIQEVLGLGEASLVLSVAETAISILGVHHPELVAELLGAVDAMREREGRPRQRHVEQTLRRDLEEIKKQLPPERWTERYQTGRERNVEDLLSTARGTART